MPVYLLLFMMDKILLLINNPING